jgi:hypothetical protein
VQPAARQPVLDAFWHLAAERQQIYFRRHEGLAPPWTTDEILNEYKFCNAYRASDRVSQYLIRDVIYVPGHYSTSDQLLRIILFRLFSKPATWELLADAFGDVTSGTFDADAYAAVLDEAFAARRTLYTGAFILCANRAYGHERKHRNHLALLEAMMAPRGLERDITHASTLRNVYEALARFPLIGPFMAYQLAIDLNYSEVIDFSENDCSIAGPGATRGIAKCFVDTRGWGDERVIRWMTDRQDEEFARLRLDFRSLHGRPLHAIDIQNLFCEVDKYSRVAFPDLKSNRSRIKARFTPAGPLPQPFYPPKWKLVPGDRGEPAGGRARRCSSAADEHVLVAGDQHALW